jgi:hypothetical protein
LVGSPCPRGCVVGKHRSATMGGAPCSGRPLGCGSSVAPQQQTGAPRSYASV